MLRAEEATRIATALGVEIADVIGGPRGGLEEPEIERYVAEPNDPYRGFESANRYLHRVKGRSLDQLDINDGDLVLVDDSDEAVKNIAPLKVAMVAYHPEPNGPAILLLRQFVPPKQLVSNSSGEAFPILNLDRDDVQIMGVVVRVVRSFVI